MRQNSKERSESMAYRFEQLRKLEEKRNFENSEEGFEIFERGLNAWVNEIPESQDERNSRIEARKRILECKTTNSDFLDLGSLGLTSLPAEIWNLLDLQELYAPNNQITKIPAGIGEFMTLQSLTLPYNQIQEIPTGIGNLWNLNSLNLGYNQIQEIPTEISKLEELKVLSLSHNQIQKIPTEISKLEELLNLDLSHNQIYELPDEFLEMHSKISLLFYNDESIAGMNDVQLFKYARQKAVIKFLEKQVQTTIDKVKACEHPLGEEEIKKIRSDYFQAAPLILRPELPKIAMLCPTSSNVTEGDLDTAVAEFNSQNTHLIAEYIYNNKAGLRNHPTVKGLIAKARTEEFKDNDDLFEKPRNSNTADSSSLAGGGGIQMKEGGIFAKAGNHMNKYENLMVKEIENFLERIMETSSALSSPKPAAMASGEELNLPILAQDSATNRQIGDDADTRMVASELQLNEGAIQARELPSNAPRNTTLPPNTFASNIGGRGES